MYFGRGAYGIQAASQAYFGVDAKKLDLAQSAVLASVLNNPAALDPANGAAAAERLLGRYQYVLDSMATMKTASAADVASIRKALPKFPKIKNDTTYGGQRGHVLTMVRKQSARPRLQRAGDPGWRPAGHHHLHQEGHERGQGGRGGGEAGGLRQEPPRRGRLGRAGHRRGPRHLRRPGLPPVAG
ncbi:transglycosylase domain-containing protein [Nocardioides convexus]|uniref:transglycosylase domain-containing protein n=1 Tax=Nocardioides convexus TaxID=2712224 RepID=UPI002418596B|nr:transglycosylase domain-containing protein [Nocardioides convexus]